MLKKHILTLSALMCCFSISQAENLIAGYIDITASGSAVKVDMAQAHEDGYNMVVFGLPASKMRKLISMEIVKPLRNKK